MSTQGIHHFRNCDKFDSNNPRWVHQFFAKWIFFFQCSHWLSLICEKPFHITIRTLHSTMYKSNLFIFIWWKTEWKRLGIILSKIGENLSQREIVDILRIRPISDLHQFPISLVHSNPRKLIINNHKENNFDHYNCILCQKQSTRNF